MKAGVQEDVDAWVVRSLAGLGRMCTQRIAFAQRAKLALVFWISVSL